MVRVRDKVKSRPKAHLAHKCSCHLSSLCIYTKVMYVLNFCNKIHYGSCWTTHCFFTFFFLTGLIAYTICHINLSDCEI